MSTSSKTRAILVALTLAAVAPLLSACNTTAGAGQDIQAGGAAVTRGADRVKSGL